MEWWIIYLVPAAISGIIEAIIFHKFVGLTIAVLIIWGLVIVIFRGDAFEHLYAAYVENNGQGDHPWFEWTYTKENYKWIINQFDNDTFIKIDLDTFKKYLYVNQDRYELHHGYVIFDDENTETLIRLVFPRRQLFKYFLFRRAYLQNVAMQGMLKFVQKDIDKTLEDAQSYIDKAQKEFKSQFNQIKNGEDK